MLLIDGMYDDEWAELVSILHLNALAASGDPCNLHPSCVHSCTGTGRSVICSACCLHPFTSISVTDVDLHFRRRCLC